MALQIKKASRADAKLRMAINAPSGSGKTFTSLQMAFGSGLVDNPKVVVIDTEHGSSQKYTGLKPDDVAWNFDIIGITEKQKYAPATYIEAIEMAEEAGYNIIIIDSLSHAWEAEGGTLDMQQKAGGRFTDWGKITSLHNQLIRKILNSKSHVIATMRTKTEWAKDESSGKVTPVKVGLEAVQRKGTEYEFDVVLRMDVNHMVTVEKTRFNEMDGKSTTNPSGKFISPIVNFLNDAKGEAEGEVVYQRPYINNPTELFDYLQKEFQINEEMAGAAMKENDITGFKISETQTYIDVIKAAYN